MTVGRTLWPLAMAVGVGVLGLGMGPRVGTSVGWVDMTFLNNQLEFVANQQGAEFSPLRVAWRLGLEVPVWSVFAVGAEGTFVRGQAGGRVVQEQYIVSLSVSAVFALAFGLLGWPVEVSLGGTGCWARAWGLVDGWGWGLGGRASLWTQLFSLGPIRGGVQVTLVYLPIPSLYNERGRIESRGWPGADFTGVYLGVSLGWK